MSEIDGFWKPLRQAGVVALAIAGLLAIGGYRQHADAQPHKTVRSQTHSMNGAPVHAEMCDDLSRLKQALSPTDYSLAQKGATELPGGYKVETDAFGDKKVCVPVGSTITDVRVTQTTTHTHEYDQPSDKLSQIMIGGAGALGLAGILLELPYRRLEFDGPADFPARETIGQ